MRPLSVLSWLIAAFFSIVGAAKSAKANCEPKFTIYDVNNGTTYATYPAFGTWLIDLSAAFSGANFNVIADFCDSSVKSAKFIVKDNADDLVETYIDNTIPFTPGSNPNGSIPPAFLKKQGNYAFKVYGYAVSDARKAPISVMTFNLEILPPIQVTDITFVDASTGKDIPSATCIFIPFQPCRSLDLNTWPVNSSISVRVNKTVGNVGSVQFNLVGVGLNENRTNYSYLDNKALFALGGKAPDGKYNPVSFLSHPGTFTLTTTAYSGTNKQGDSGQSLFTLILQGFRRDGSFHPFQFVNAVTKSPLKSDFSIDLSLYPANTTFSIVPKTQGRRGGSISYQLSKYTQVNVTLTNYDDPVPIFKSVQTKAPYPLGGFSKSGQYNSVEALQHSGIYHLEATTFEGTPNQGYPSDLSVLIFQVFPRFKLTKVTLVDVKSGKDVLVFPSDEGGVNIDLMQYPANSAFTIRAYSNGGVGSVAFKLTKSVDFDTDENVIWTVDNKEPFTVDGKSTVGNYQAIPELSIPGYYSLRFMPYGKSDLKGDAGFSMLYNIGVLPRFSITQLNLVDAAKRKILDENFDVIDLSHYPAQETFSITANTTGKVGSIEYILYRITTVNNANNTKKKTTLLQQVVNDKRSFPLRGISNGTYVPAQVLKVAGLYQLTATPYYLLNKGGEKGPTVELEFEVLPQFGVNNLTWVDASTGHSLEVLESFGVLYLNKYPSAASFDIQAITYGSVGSVYFDLSLWNETSKKFVTVINRVDNLGPFTLSATASVPGKVNYSSVPRLRVVGRYLLKVTPFASANRKGIQGHTGEYEFRVVPSLGTCATYCGVIYVPRPPDLVGPCSCNATCVDQGSCCLDYCDQCAQLSPSVCK